MLSQVHNSCHAMSSQVKSSQVKSSQVNPRRVPEDELPGPQTQPSGHEALVECHWALGGSHLLAKHHTAGRASESVMDTGTSRDVPRGEGARQPRMGLVYALDCEAAWSSTFVMCYGSSNCGPARTLRQQSRVPLYGMVPSGRAVWLIMRDLATSAGVEHREATKLCRQRPCGMHVRSREARTKGKAAGKGVRLAHVGAYTAQARVHRCARTPSRWQSIGGTASCRL